MALGEIDLSNISKTADFYKQMYLAGKEDGAAQAKELPKTEYVPALAFYIEENLTGKISNNPEDYNADQRCFNALGIIAGLAEEALPESGISEIVSETIEKLYENINEWYKLNKASKTIVDCSYSQLVDEITYSKKPITVVAKIKKDILLEKLDIQFDKIVTKRAKKISELIETYTSTKDF